MNSIVAQEASSGSLTLLLHPVVVINISDHWTRSKVQNNFENPRVIGALMGLQTGRTVEISNSFELAYDVVDGNVVIEHQYLVQKQEQFRKVFPTLDFLGWYSSGSSVHAADMEIHKQFFGINESPLFLLLDPIACARPDTKDLPIYILESELKIVNEQPSLVFVKVNYKIETNEAERIAVDHVAKITPSGSGATGSQLSAHLIGIHGSLSMLNVRVKILLKFLEGVKTGKIPKDHGVLRAVTQLCNQLPQADTSDFRRDFISEYNDVLMITYLASITKGTANINDLIDKFNVIYDRQVRRRGLY
jgi:COP9 signalosome complex subunit 6